MCDKTIDVSGIIASFAGKEQTVKVVFMFAPVDGEVEPDEAVDTAIIDFLCTPTPLPHVNEGSGAVNGNSIAIYPPSHRK